MAKPLFVEGFTQEQRNNWVKAANSSGLKLNDWVAKACDQLAKIEAEEAKEKADIS